ncbi:MAG TPA: hypothetical protein VF138_04795 [Caulobacteraceae bacterium]
MSAPAHADVFLASDERRRPARVVMLAAAFSAVTTIAMAGASQFFDHLDGGRYAEDIIRVAIARA